MGNSGAILQWAILHFPWKLLKLWDGEVMRFLQQNKKMEPFDCIESQEKLKSLVQKYAEWLF